MTDAQTDGSVELPRKLAVVVGLVSICGVVMAIFFGILTVKANNKVNALQEEIVALQRANSSFDAKLQAGSLVLTSDGSAFTEPDSLSIIPVFSSVSGPPKNGEQVEIPLNSGLIQLSNGTIAFSDIERTICAYKVNEGLCMDAELSLDTLLVTFVVNGVKDTDPVRFKSS